MQHARAKSWFDTFMWLVLAIFVTLGVSALWGCGEATEDDLLDLEQAEQGYTAEDAPYGWRTDGTNLDMSCAASDTSQVCNLPASKNVKVNLVTTGMVAGDITLATQSRDALVTAYANQFSASGWNVSSGSASATVTIQKGTNPSLGGADDARQFVRLTCNSPTTLTESAPGSYRKCASITATVDYDKLFGAFGAGGMSKAVFHVIGIAFQAGFGVGLQTTDSTKISFRTVSGTANRNSTMATRESCNVKAAAPSGSSLTLVNDC